MTEHLSELLRFWAARFPERVAVTFDDWEVTWGALDRTADEIAAGLQQRGIGHGDIVGVLMNNCPEFIETVSGVFRAGAAIELLNIRFTPSEMLYPITDGRPKLVVTEAAHVERLAEAVIETPELRVVTIDGVAGTERFADLRVPGATPRPVDWTAEDIALLTYTSGTTGFPKGAMLSHRNIIANGQLRGMADGIGSTDRMLLTIPLAYTGGIGLYLREALCMGAQAVIVRTFDPETTLATLAANRITTWSSVPTIFQNLLLLPAFASADLSALRVCTAAGSVVPMELLRAFSDATGVGLQQGYGQTECGGGFATQLYADQAAAHQGSAGRPLMFHSIRIVDDNDNDVPVGESGEILVRGPSVMVGYLNQPEATAETLRGGWLHTGDIGTVDEGGFLTVVDRLKDLIVSGGLNVYPAEVEKLLDGRFGIEECAIVGVPDERWGEVPALVVPSADRINVDELRATIETKLADYKRPKWLVPSGGALPRTLSGKILKRELRGQFAQLPADAVSLK